MRVIRLTSLAEELDELLPPLEPDYVHNVSSYRSLAVEPLPSERRRRRIRPVICPCGCGLKLGQLALRA